MQSRIDRLFNGLPDGCGVFISGYPNIFYYSGFTSEDAFLLMTKTEKAEWIRHSKISIC